MQAAMSGMGYSFSQLTPTQLSASYSGASGTQMINRPANLICKNEPAGNQCIQTEIHDSQMTYDNYANSESTNNDLEPCSSSVSPRSQEEHTIMAPFADTYNASEQEKKKLARKRERNRMAATKCRQRKLEKINELEKQVDDEKAMSNRLNEDLKILETSIAQLRQLLHHHQSNGCVIPSKVLAS